MKSTITVSTENFFKDAIKKVTIHEDRKNLLLGIAEGVAKEYAKNKTVHLNFICTHNSRRSQLGQVWSFFAANFFGLNIKAYSGGTEITSFHRNTIKTLQKVGFTFQLVDFSHQNPKYLISFNGTNKSILGYSKRFDCLENPESYIAITTCNDADKNCPFVPKATYRFHLPYVDPKDSDSTNLQETIYLKINKKVAAEMFFIFSEISKLIS
ncbi:hypothetical protein MC378_03410 [Polaribacter sp. MSW13]|uniref:Arsenate reductase n=1 Tax=Polaribacter marinus TaxID=2916838 RepID=A0A9X1VL83_9FLAO|nr:hypothetical protein [Polaribacter marinus]MCI2228201.1 hypothetical protein [Polaribacter marinus]